MNRSRLINLRVSFRMGSRLDAEAERRQLTLSALVRHFILAGLDGNEPASDLDVWLDEAQALIHELRLMREGMRLDDDAPEAGA